MQEKRKAIRIEKSLMVKYSPEINNKDNWNISFVKNVSETGILFDTNKQFQAGENILMLLKIPLDPYNWLEIKGSVIESSPYIGKVFLTRLKFICINKAECDLIKNYVGWYLNSKNSHGQLASQNEKRKAERMYKSLMVSYGIQNHLGVVEKWDITSIRNFSKTGMVFTSGYHLEDKVDFMIKLPSHPYDSFHIRGMIIESSALILPNSETTTGTFLTRVESINLRDEQTKLIGDYIDWLIKNDPDRPKKEDVK